MLKLPRCPYTGKLRSKCCEKPHTALHTFRHIYFDNFFTLVCTFDPSPDRFEGHILYVLFIMHRNFAMAFLYGICLFPSVDIRL